MRGCWCLFFFFGLNRYIRTYWRGYRYKKRSRLLRARKVERVPVSTYRSIEQKKISPLSSFLTVNGNAQCLSYYMVYYICCMLCLGTSSGGLSKFERDGEPIWRSAIGRLHMIMMLANDENKCVLPSFPSRVSFFKLEYLCFRIYSLHQCLLSSLPSPLPV